MHARVPHLGRLHIQTCMHAVEDSKVAGTHHTRYSADPNITAQDLVDSYMAPFQACVEKGGVSSLMCSYNALNGVPTCAQPPAVVHRGCTAHPPSLRPSLTALA